MKNRFLHRWLITAILGVSILAGCGSEKEDTKAVYRQMGIEYMEQGDYASAIASFETALKQEVGTVDADDLDIAYYKAAAQYASGDMEAAMATYNAILDYDKDAYQAFYLRGCLYGKQGNVEAAKADFENAVKYNGNDYELYLNIYENLVGIGATEDGEAYLQKALAIKGSELINLEYRGQIHYLLGDYETATQELKAAVEAGSISANLYLAKCYENTGDDTAAEEAFRAYIAAVPADAVALNELGEIMLEKEMYTEAVSYFEQAMDCETVPNNRALMHNLIVAYEYNGNFDKAWAVVQEYVTLFPEDEDAQREYIFLKNRQMKEEETEDTEADSTETTE